MATLARPLAITTGSLIARGARAVAWTLGLGMMFFSGCVVCWSTSEPADAAPVTTP